MNERIKQLAEQAGGEFYEGFAGSTNFVKFAENDFEKFAELIVRECVKIADVADENKCEWIGGNILTHFGVEE